MKTDLYTKIILTVIAGALVLNLFLSSSVLTVNAQEGTYQGPYWIKAVPAFQEGQLRDLKGSPLRGVVVGFSCSEGNACWAVGH